MTDDPQGAGFPAEMLTDGARAVLAERHRQMAVEGFNAEHDDAHTKGELARAAAAYIQDVVEPFPPVGLPPNWPFPRSWWKPGTKRRNLVKAAALLLAEIDRLDRLEDLQVCGTIVPTLQFREVQAQIPMQRMFNVVLGELFVGIIYSLRTTGWATEFFYEQDEKDGGPLSPHMRTARCRSLAVAKRDFAEAVKAWLDKAQLQPIVAAADAGDKAEG